MNEGLPLQEQIDGARIHLETLTERFQRFTQVRDAAVGSFAPAGKSDAAGRLRMLAGDRASLICTEIDGLLDVSRLSHERVSLLLRFRPQIHGGDASGAAAQIQSDLATSVNCASLAAEFMRAASSLAPEADMNNIEAAITTSLGESSRFIEGIQASPLWPEDVAQFHSMYEAPADPLLAYNEKTEGLALGTIRLVGLSAERVENIMTYVGSIDSVIKPSFPEHAEGMEGQAQDMLQEARGTFSRADALLDRARAYAAELK